MASSQSNQELVDPVPDKMKRAIHIDILSIFFGIGTWVVVNGLWVELPLLVNALPEGWNLPSYLTIIVQLANIAPITYTILHTFYRDTFTETRVIYFVITVGLVANALLVFYWDSTSYLFGTARSTALLALVFCLAMVDTSSRVLYLPFMARFQGIYLTSFFIGEGFSGLVPSVFALIQGVGGNPECRLVNVTTGNLTEEKIEPYTYPPRFSIEVFFVFLFLMVLLSLIAFHLLTYDSIVGKALAVSPNKIKIPTEVLLDASDPQNSYHSISPSNSPERTVRSGQRVRNESPVPIIISNSGVSNEKRKSYQNEPLFQHVAKPVFIYLLTIQTIVCALANGVFPSVQSYSCVPYGNVAYHLSATLSTMANPIVCLLLFILPKPTKMSITSIFVASLAVAMYLMTTAVQSPTPLLVGETSGEVLLVVGWILLVGTFTYVKVSIATVLRDEGKRGLFLVGAFTQAGSAIGAITSFFVVNYTNIFTSYEACHNVNDMTTDDPTIDLIF